MNSTIDDVDSHVVYSTNPPWQTDLVPGQSPRAYLGTNHRAQHPNASATFTFTGTAVFVYGHKASDSAFRHFSVDGASPAICDGRTGSQGGQSLLYWRDGLSPGTHTMTIEHKGAALEWLCIDFFVITSPETTSASAGPGDPSGSIAGASPSASPPSQVSSSAQSPITTIVVGIMATVAIIAVIALICFLCYRHRRKVKQQQQQAEEHKDAVAFIPAAALSRGSGPGPGPYVFQPFNPYNLSPSSADTNAPPVAIASTHPWEPHGPSSHFPPEDDQVRSDSSPSTPPASSNRTSVQTRSSSIHTPPLVMSYPPRRALSTSTTASTRTDRESTHTRVESLNHQTRVHYAGENDTKAYHGRATMASFSSSPSRPLSPSTISESLLPPPQYEC